MIFSARSCHDLTLAGSLSKLISPAALLKGTWYFLTLLHYWQHGSLRWHWHPPSSLFPISDGYPTSLAYKHFPPEVHDIRLQYLLLLLVTTEFPSLIQNGCWHLTPIIVFSKNFNHQQSKFSQEKLFTRTQSVEISQPHVFWGALGFASIPDCYTSVNWNCSVYSLITTPFIFISLNSYCK